MHQQVPPGGVLYLKVREGKMQRDTDFFSKMDPYCLIDYNGRKYKTRVHQSGGKNPKWGNEFELPVTNMNDEIRFTVMDEDVTNDDIVGVGTCKVYELVANGMGVNDWFSVLYKNKIAGQILFETRYTPPASGNYTMLIQGMPQQQPIHWQQPPGVYTQYVGSYMNNQVSQYQQNPQMMYSQYPPQQYPPQQYPPQQYPPQQYPPQQYPPQQYPPQQYPPQQYPPQQYPPQQYPPQQYPPQQYPPQQIPPQQIPPQQIPPQQIPPQQIPPQQIPPQQYQQQKPLNQAQPNMQQNYQYPPNYQPPKY